MRTIFASAAGLAAGYLIACGPPPKGAGTVKSTFQRIYDDVIFARLTIPQAAAKFITEAQQAISS